MRFRFLLQEAQKGFPYLIIFNTIRFNFVSTAEEKEEVEKLFPEGFTIPENFVLTVKPFRFPPNNDEQPDLPEIIKGKFQSDVFFMITNLVDPQTKEFVEKLRLTNSYCHPVLFGTPSQEGPNEANVSTNTEEISFPEFEQTAVVNTKNDEEIDFSAFD